MASRFPARTTSDFSVSSWGKPAVGGFGVVAGYGVATGTPSVSSSYSDGGFNWKRIDFTSTTTLVVSTAGLFDVLVNGGGGGGGGSAGGGEGGAGGGAGVSVQSSVYLSAGTYTVTVGAGGANGEPGTVGGWSGISVVKLQIPGGQFGGYRWAGAQQGPNSGGASYRGGYGGNSGVASTQLYGYSSGSSNGSGENGGGAGQGGAGGTRTAGAGFTSTFSGTSTTYCAGGIGGGSSGTTAGHSAANSGNGGGGACGVTTGANGGSGLVIVRWRV
jgi:hypothetical protein